MSTEPAKAAHATKEQKALGYINAASEGLQSALWWLGNDSEYYEDVAQLSNILRMVKERMVDDG